MSNFFKTTDEDRYGRKCKDCDHYATSHYVKSDPQNILEAYHFVRINCRKCSCAKYR